ncbi:hypothetical protein [Streptosporangium saharense]|uniref:hypothetical protein n=1 Tax=Streptosporangium saharense TaxID=1706840 RepID=UPI00343AD722
MGIRYVGKWDASPDGESPTLWVDEEKRLVYMQGYRVEDPELEAELLAAAGRDRIPANETLIAFPDDMIDLFPGVRRGDSGPQSG